MRERQFSRLSTSLSRGRVSHSKQTKQLLGREEYEIKKNVTPQPLLAAKAKNAKEKTNEKPEVAQSKRKLGGLLRNCDVLEVVSDWGERLPANFPAF